MKWGRCEVAECEETMIVAHGLCDRHYRRWRKTGKLGPAGLMRGPNGAGSIEGEGYRLIYVGYYIKEHVWIAQQALGRKLKHPECVHHVDGCRSNNAPSNLVICPNQKYHMLLHRRTRRLI